MSLWDGDGDARIVAGSLMRFLESSGKTSHCRASPFGWQSMVTLLRPWEHTWMERL